MLSIVTQNLVNMVGHLGNGDLDSNIVFDRDTGMFGVDKSAKRAVLGDHNFFQKMIHERHRIFLQFVILKTELRIEENQFRIQNSEFIIIYGLPFHQGHIQETLSMLQIPLIQIHQVHTP